MTFREREGTGNEMRSIRSHSADNPIWERLWTRE